MTTSAKHRAGGGAHAAFDAAAFEGGPGGTGTGHEETVIADDDLPVGADIDEQADLLGVRGKVGA